MDLGGHCSFQGITRVVIEVIGVETGLLEDGMNDRLNITAQRLDVFKFCESVLS